MMTSSAKGLHDIHSVRHQRACLDEVLEIIDRGQVILDRKLGDSLPLRDKMWAR
jgi:hypothetical protein